MTRTPTNESPAPQAEASEHAPWSEDEEDAERLLACASRRKKYGDENCECDEDGSCVECEYDMQDVLKKRYAPLKHTTTPAPQPPVEGLREALREAIDVFEGMNDDEINEELLPRLKAALASPSLTAVEQSGEAAMREALTFYADPFAWKAKHDPDDVVRIPDFYSETSFGDKAADALAETRRTDGRFDP